VTRASSDPGLPAPLEPFPDGRADAGVAAARERLQAAGVEPVAWSNGPGDRYAAHEHVTTKLLVCATGSITFFVGDAMEPAELRAGEGFVLPAGTRHSAIVGSSGCTCLEGHRP
jgi:quercetin dioxygenase-like cupin family protein